jgi:hypothetical protein
MFGLMKKAMESRPFSPAKCDFSSSSKWEKNQLNDEEKQMKTKIETLTLTSFSRGKDVTKQKTMMFMTLVSHNA